jgi:hypothetical protein
MRSANAVHYRVGRQRSQSNRIAQVYVAPVDIFVRCPNATAVVRINNDAFAGLVLSRRWMLAVARRAVTSLNAEEK